MVLIQRLNHHWSSLSQWLYSPFPGIVPGWTSDSALAHVTYRVSPENSAGTLLPWCNIKGVRQLSPCSARVHSLVSLHLRAGLTCKHHWSRLHQIPCVCQCDVNRHEGETFNAHIVGFTSCTPVICCEMNLAGWLVGTRKWKCLWNRPEPDLKLQNQVQPCLSLKQNGTAWPRQPFKRRTSSYLCHHLPVTEFRAVCYSVIVTIATHFRDHDNQTCLLRLPDVPREAKLPSGKKS